MKAAIYHGIEKVTVEERPIPTPGPKDVVVRNIRAGICGTDVGAYYYGGEPVGILPENEFGHEMSSLVYAVGSEVRDIKEGMRVFIDPCLSKPPGSAPPVEIADMCGAFSEYVLIEEAAIDYNIYPLPDNVSFDEACLIEPFSVGTRGANIGRAKRGERAVVYGAGTIGLAAFAALKCKGLEEVVVVDVVPWRLEIAKKMGAIPFNAKTDGSLGEFLIKKFGGNLTNMLGQPAADVDLYLDAAGTANIIPEFLNICKWNARLVILAVYKISVEIAPFFILAAESEILGSCGYKTRDIKEAIEYLAGKNTGMENLITHHFRLDEINEAFKTANKLDQALKVVIDYE